MKLIINSFFFFIIKIPKACTKVSPTKKCWVRSRSSFQTSSRGLRYS